MDYEEDDPVKRAKLLAEQFADVGNEDVFLLKQILIQLKDINEKLDRLVIEKD